MGSSHSIERCFKPRRDVRFRVIDREAVVLRQDAGEALVLNEVGTRILQLLDGTTPMTDIARQLAREFLAETHEIEEDCHDFIARLSQIGVIETVGATP